MQPIDQPIDLRSDTVTQPTEAMREAMRQAPVGDDVYAEDPSINRLQAMLAEMTGFEAGLFMPSGTMSNQVALAVHAQRGYEVIMPQGAHIYEYELGAMAVISGLLPRPVPAPLGVPEPEAIRAAIHRSIHQAPTGLIVLENSHNKAGGTLLPQRHAEAIAALAREEGLPLHLDGARAFNAATALGISIAALCEPFDSVSICLSKGLAAPVGTVLLGSQDFIRQAHRYRKLLGGGMRQAGVVAAAAIVALETMVDRLVDDHRRAKQLAENLRALPGLRLDMQSVQTNMVYIHCAAAPQLAQQLAQQGVLCNALGAEMIRLVTHYQIDDQDISQASEIIAALLQARDTQVVQA